MNVVADVTARQSERKRGYAILVDYSWGIWKHSETLLNSWILEY